MLHVTQILYSGLGGHASVAFSLIAGDTNRKWTSSLLFVGIEKIASPYLRHCGKFSIPFESIQSRQGQPWRSWPSIYAALQRLAPDVVILHSINSLPPVALYCYLKKIRLITVEHTSIALRTRRERIISALTFVLAMRIVVLTHPYKNAYLTEFNPLKRAHKVVVIPNGVDVNMFSRLRCHSLGGTFCIGMAARFSSTKRQDLLVLALAQLVERRPDVRWRLTFAGDGDYLDAVRRQVVSSGIVGNVDFMGHLDEVRLVEWFHSLDLYVHASEGEALSTSMLQAMSMSLPIVASAVSGITDLLENSQTQLGVLITDNTPEAFADGIEALQSDLDMQVRLGAASRECVLRNYSQEMMFQSYDKLIQECRI